MDTTKCRARSCDVSNITDHESQRNLQIFKPMMTQETAQRLDEEEVPQCMNEDEPIYNDYTNPCKPLQKSDCVDYNDCNLYVLEELKKEFPENECPQSVHNRNSRSVLENGDISQVIERQEIKQENLEESTSLIKIEEVFDEQYPVVVKIESLEEQTVLENFGDSGVHYDVLVTPQQVQCELCDRTFKNRLTLLIHKIEHLKVIMYLTPVDIKMNKIHKCNCCNEHFNSHNNMLAHVRDVHSNERHKSKLYHKGIKPYLTRTNGKKIKYKCDLCERIYKSKKALLFHSRKIHIDYGRMFPCWCGKQFHTPVHLSAHKYEKHSKRVLNKSNDKFQCDSCPKQFKIKSLLMRHIKQVHYDYGKTFECWCGKQFRTPINLSEHKKGHCDDVQCDYCDKILKTKLILANHIKRMHYDYGKTFECSCGKQFRSPIHLSIHKKRLHNPNGKITSNEQFQCDSCHKIFKTRNRLICHIKNVHYDYGQTFDCWCGKQFRTPIHLSEHKKGHLDQDVQCHYCNKFLKNKYVLANHIKRMHYDYGKTFECSCGKEFRTPNHLYQHERRLHNVNVKIIKNEQLQCDFCHKLFDNKKGLSTHIKRMHYDYGKTFECWCGKQFRTPIHLSIHSKGHQDEVQCDYCHKFFKSKYILTKHINSIHYDYGKTFECWCGKQFRTPTYLYGHQKRVHCADVKNISNERFQCHICSKLLKTKKCLAGHIKDMHYDYGKTFECSCGKQFRTPRRLRVHEHMRHGTTVRTVTNSNATLAGNISKPSDIKS